ncbi:MAG: aldo/keto reductase [Methanobrevibacter sp.]|jgi:predicted aldo/keto reductase-like oxidoreductase|nr:aldo/keto reductase [Candidatus Methanoflexus mossambicus]
MKYRKIEKTGEELSLLGYGCMRYPRKNGRIDYKRTKNQIIFAIENGVNYFDTAYMYPGSEEVLGKVLAHNYKDKTYRDYVKIASKLPMLSVKNRPQMDEIFKKELKRLKTDFIDYYYLHSLNLNQWKTLKNELICFLNDLKKNGSIKNVGFSFHGNLKDFKEIIDDYDWDCVMIQYNYLDENYQAGSKGLDYAYDKGLAIVIMEPLRGGTLANKLPKEGIKLINSFPIKRTPAQWAFSWVMNNPKVHTVLSGMNKESEITENIATASAINNNGNNNGNNNLFDDDENNLINSLKEEFNKNIVVNCTSCGYCLPCPQGVDIPTAFSSLNDKTIFSGIDSLKALIQYLNINLGNDSLASNCTKCRICESKCPQHINIINNLDLVKNRLEKSYLIVLFKIGHFILSKVL